jgi:hypothetical protein
MSLTEEVDKSGTSCIACTHADTDFWDRLEDWKLFDDLAWKNLEKVVNELFSDKAKVVKTIQDAYRMSFRLMQIQSDASVQKTVLNHLKDVLFCKVKELQDSDDRKIDLDHELEISEDKLKKEILKVIGDAWPCSFLNNGGN